MSSMLTRNPETTKMAAKRIPAAKSILCEGILLLGLSACGGNVAQVPVVNIPAVSPGTAMESAGPLAEPLKSTVVLQGNQDGVRVYVMTYDQRTADELARVGEDIQKKAAEVAPNCPQNDVQKLLECVQMNVSDALELLRGFTEAMQDMESRIGMLRGAHVRLEVSDQGTFMAVPGCADIVTNKRETVVQEGRETTRYFGECPFDPSSYDPKLIFRAVFIPQKGQNVSPSMRTARMDEIF